MLTPNSVYTANGVKMCKYLLTEARNNPNKINLPSKRTKPLLKITIHNTPDLENVYDDAEQYTRATVNGNMGTVVPTAYLDDVGGWQLLPEDWCNWTNTDGSGVGNTQTLTIECIMSGTNTPEDQKAYDNCARLAAYWLHKYDLKEDDIVTHTYWLHVRDGHTSLAETDKIDYWCCAPHPYKLCPYYIIPTWLEFKKLVAKYYRALKGYPSESEVVQETTKEPEQDEFPYRVKIICDELNVRENPGTSSKVVTTVTKNYIYTIVEKQYVGDVPWGRLISPGAGWISLLPKYVEKL